MRFRIRDVYIPGPEVVLDDLFGNDVLQGEVVDLSDSGLTDRAFVIVKVERMRHFLIVPIDHILTVV